MLILQQAARLRRVKTEGLVKNSPKMHSLTPLHFHFYFNLCTISSRKLEEIASSIFTSPRSAFKIKASKVLLVDESLSIQILQHFFPA